MGDAAGSCSDQRLSPGLFIGPGGEPEMRWDFLETEIAALLDGGSSPDAFVSAYEGVALSLAWPPASRLLLTTASRLGVGSADLARLETKYLCCLGFKLWTLGIAAGFTSAGTTFEILMLVGELGETYAYAVWIDDALYRLSEDLRGLATRGLARYDPLYSVIHDDSVPFFMRDTPSVDDVVAYAQAARGTLVPLTWPPHHSFKWFVPDEPVLRWRILPGGRLAIVIGGFYASDLHPFLARQRILLDARGRIYALDLHTAVVIKLAATLRAFLHLGPRRLFKNYRLAPVPSWFMRLPVTCIHAPIVHLPEQYHFLCPPSSVSEVLIQREQFLRDGGNMPRSSSLLSPQDGTREVQKLE